MKDLTRIITSETHSWRGFEVRTVRRNEGNYIELLSMNGPTLIGLGLTKEQAILLGQDLIDRAATLDGDISGDTPLPIVLERHVNNWLISNQIEDSSQVICGKFPLGMVLRWIERAEKAEAVLRQSVELANKLLEGSGSHKLNSSITKVVD